MHLTGLQQTVKRARKLRREMSLQEVLLYRELRKRPQSLIFRRQHLAGPYVLDFFCPAARLCVEIDGDWHSSRQPQDAARDAWLADQGVVTLRIAAADVLGNLEGVVMHIVNAALARTPTPSALRAATPS